MAMAYRTSYRWWVLAIRASRKKDNSDTKNWKMNGDLLFGGFVFNSSQMKLFHFHSAARCPFYLRSTHTSKRKLSLCIDASALPLPYTRKKDNKCTISNRHWSSSFIHWMMLCHNACCHSTKYYFPLETIFTICGKCRFGLFFPC